MTRTIDADALINTLNEKNIPVDVRVNYEIMNAPTIEPDADTISRSRAIKDISEWATDILHPDKLVKEDALHILESLPSAEPKTETVLCALADRLCPFQGKEFAWCLTCPHISEEDRNLVKKTVSEPSRNYGEWVGCTGCEHYNQQQTAMICRECRRYYKDKHSEIFEGRMNDGVDSKRTKV